MCDGFTEDIPTTLFKIIREESSMSIVAGLLEMDRASLYRSLKKGVKPRIDTIEKILNILRYRIKISKMEEAPNTEICGICNKEINHSLRFPDPKSASLDHIIPKSLGGSNKRGNIQVVHLFCNISKGGKRRRLRDDRGHG